MEPSVPRLLWPTTTKRGCYRLLPSQAGSPGAIAFVHLGYICDTWLELNLTLPAQLESFVDNFERTWIGTHSTPPSLPRGYGISSTTYWLAFLNLLTSLKDGTAVFGVSWAAVILVYKIPYRRARAWPSASREQRYLAYNSNPTIWRVIDVLKKEQDL